MVEIIAYSLLPNHFHLLLKQKEEDGISEFMKKVGGGYTKFYNNKYDRSGSLFQGKFKAVHIDSQNYLEYLSAYINGNSEIHKIKKSEKYSWSSYQYYLKKKHSPPYWESPSRGEFNKEVVLKNFQNIDEYKKFVEDVIKNSFERKEDIKIYLE